MAQSDPQKVVNAEFPVENQLQLATITPAKQLVFVFDYSANTCETFIEIKNNTPNQITYKIKGTDPRKYSVTPHTGVVEEHGFATVRVSVSANYERSMEISQVSHKDKFLVSVMQIFDMYEKQPILAEVWKSVPKDPTKFQQHVLHCAAGSIPRNLSNAKPFRPDPQVAEISGMLTANSNLESHLSSLVKFQLFLSVIILTCGIIVLLILYIGKPFQVVED